MATIRTHEILYSDLPACPTCELAVAYALTTQNGSLVRGDLSDRMVTYAADPATLTITLQPCGHELQYGEADRYREESRPS